MRAFARNEPEASDTFDTLAVDIARFQARYNPGYARLVAERSASLDRLDGLPAVPCDAFRLTRMAVHPAELDEVRFRTSGTTGSPGIHPFRTTRTYRELALAFGAKAAAMRHVWTALRWQGFS